MSEYTAEEYRDVIMAIHYMDGVQRKEVFGENSGISDYVKGFSVSELIEKYRAYVNTPKAGEYWKNNDGQMIIVRYIKSNIVFYYYCSDGVSSYMRCDTFVECFTKTEYQSQYLESFIEEMKEVSE